MGIIQFKTEYQVNPIGITNPKPRFSWLTNGIQNQYRLTVGTKRGASDLWDSGIVNSKDSIQIEYDGKPLTSRQIGYVSCTTYGEGSATCESTFEMGLMNESDWHGRWVSSNANFQGESIMIRKNFELLSQPIARARVYICGLGYHELYFNGKKVGDRVLAPSTTDYEKRISYCTYDVTNALVGGENVIGILLGYGWRGKRELLLEFFVEYTDGTIYHDQSMNCNNWWMKNGAITRNSIYGGEEYDARLEDISGHWASKDVIPAWSNGWMFTFLINFPMAQKVSDCLEPIRVTKTFPVQTKNVLKNGHTVYGFGQNLAGWVRIKVQGASGSKLTMLFAEGLKEDGSVNQLNLRSAQCKDVYILRGNGIEEYAPKFTYHGFEFVEVIGEGDVQLLEIVAEFVHTDVRETGFFECSNPVLNQLHRNAQMTELNNLHGLMTDCPQRDERLQWLNDLASRIFQSIHNFGLERLIPKVIQDITDTQDEFGAIADTAPFIGGERPGDPINISYLLLGIKAYQYYGDRQVLDQHYGSFKKWVDYLLSHQHNYRLDYSYYGDWVTPSCFSDAPTEGSFISSAYLFWHLEVLSQIAKILNKPVDAAQYEKLCQESKLAFNKMYYDTEKKSYASGNQTSNAVALSLNLAPIADRKAIAENIAQDIQKKKNHLSCGNQGYRHLFYALGEMGYGDLLLDVLTNPEYPGWGYMVANGATTVWERWEKEMQQEMHSFNHPMFASFDGWFYEYLGGISLAADSVGANKIRIHPIKSEKIEFVHCHLDTVRGQIVSNWKKENDGIVYQISIPQTATAIVELPYSLRTINGNAVASNLKDNPLELTAGDYILVTE